MKRTRLVGLMILAISMMLASCGDKQERTEKRMEKGFRLPSGDAEDGQFAFVELKCHRCHSVRGVDLPDVENRPESIHFALGGEVRKVKTYGELVTAIIQPQHVVSEDYLATLKKEDQDLKFSPMLDYNSTMTVLQLTDLVTFLHEQYQEADPEYDVPSFYGP